MGKSHLKLVAPTTENRTVTTPRRRPNAELRTREYLTGAEVEKLIEAAKGNRYGQRAADASPGTVLCLRSGSYSTVMFRSSSLPTPRRSNC